MLYVQLKHITLLTILVHKNTSTEQNATTASFLLLLPHESNRYHVSIVHRQLPGILLNPDASLPCGVLGHPTFPGHLLSSSFPQSYCTRLSRHQVRGCFGCPKCPKIQLTDTFTQSVFIQLSGTNSRSINIYQQQSECRPVLTVEPVRQHLHAPRLYQRLYPTRLRQINSMCLPAMGSMWCIETAAG